VSRRGEIYATLARLATEQALALTELARLEGTGAEGPGPVPLTPPRPLHRRGARPPSPETLARLGISETDRAAGARAARARGMLPTR
jgi:hypothetical protein